MKQLGRTFIETIVEVPTKLVKGEQRYKMMKTWVAVPHEMLALPHLRRLRELIEETDEGYVEIRIENKTHQCQQTPRYYLLRGVVETVITISN